ncbi:rhodanese-like domain-containing protein [Peptostreptococcus faecalis]|uniref:rhodanese-like domain-containing protein n=1 Tax=Peptostreptococcus faecalis TaxID=2045015 RepID=UPI000C7B23DA|nr:rhodanese-like domain-containing protein [Peptostreptococcus faecalis]
MNKKIKYGVLSTFLVAGLVLTGCSNKKAESSNEETKSNVKLETISTADVEKNVGNDEYIFVDTRNDSYYNGFKQKDQSRGGHIEGAVQYTSDWVGKVKKEKLSKFVEDKGIKKDKKVVVYDTDKKNVDKVGGLLKELGYNVLAYDKFDEYVKNDKNKLVKFERYSQLVNSEWLKDLMDGNKPESYESSEYAIFEVSWGPVDQAKDYNKSHIKGAYHFNTDLIENGPEWNLSKPEVIQKNLQDLGITKDKTIVLYSNDQSAAYRVMFALRWAGVEDVKVLNGGLQAWESAKLPVETKVNIPKKVDSFKATVPMNPQFNISTAKEADAKMKSEGLKLISVRSWDEYIGKTSGYDYIPEKGEPKGAIWGFAGSDAANMQDYYDPDNTLRNPLELAQLWEAQGIKKEDKGAFYCGTGWRAAISWEMTQMMGWDNFVIYDGGWNLWQMDKSLPVQVGAPNNMKKPDSKNDF